MSGIAGAHLIVRGVLRPRQISRFLLVAAAALLVGMSSGAYAQTDSQTLAQRSASGIAVDSLESWTSFILAHVSEYAPKGLRAEKRMRDRFYRRGYSAILRSVAAGDEFGSLLAWVRVNLQIAYSMEHKIFWIVPPETGGGVAFPDDWSFPADPWKKEWWSEE